MPVSAAQAIWAARSGLLLALFTYLVEGQSKRNDNPSGKYLVLAVLATTFVPKENWHTFKLYAIRILRNVAFLLLWVFIAFAAAVAAISIIDDALPHLGRFLRTSELSAAWPVGFILLTILANIPWKDFVPQLWTMQYAQPA